MHPAATMPTLGLLELKITLGIIYLLEGMLEMPTQGSCP